MKKLNLLLFISLLLLLSSNAVMSQTELGVVGKIYTKTDADKLYGKVLESRTMDTDVILDALTKVDYYIMFKIIDGKIAITDKFRNQISSEKFEIKDDEVMHIYSKTKVAEVINKGGESSTKIERRADVLTITNGFSTLEMSSLCPPYCP